MKQSEAKKQAFFSIPSKTFLIGEYAVLIGAKAILLNTHPCFLFSITDKSHKKPFDLYASRLKIHPQSPAGQWLKRYPKIAKAYHIEAYDPHDGKGGFGFSSAQFSLMYLLGEGLGLYKKGVGDTLKNCVDKGSQLSITKGSAENKKAESLFSLWKSYRGLAFEGLPPSGADLVSQWMGEVCVFSLNPFQAHSSPWPFPDLDFFLVQTGVSLNTHQHLKNLDKEMLRDLSSELANIINSSISFMKAKDQKGFAITLKQYSLCLEKYGLIHPKTLIFLQQIQQLKEVIVAKGCGAMGAEVVAVFFVPKDKQKVRAFLNDKNIVAETHHLASSFSLF